MGIAAPPEISIQRPEIRDQGCERRMPTNKSDTASRATALVQVPPNLDDILAHSIARRTEGQIGSLHVETTNGRVVVHGRADLLRPPTCTRGGDGGPECVKFMSSCGCEYRIEMVTDRAPGKLTG